MVTYFFPLHLFQTVVNLGFVDAAPLGCAYLRSFRIICVLYYNLAKIRSFMYKFTVSALRSCPNFWKPYRSACMYPVRLCICDSLVLISQQSLIMFFFFPESY